MTDKNAPADNRFPCLGCRVSDGFSQRCGSCRDGLSFPAADPDYDRNPANPDRGDDADDFRRNA